MYTFPLIIGLAAALGLARVAMTAVGKSHLELLNAGLWVLLGALIGGRAVFVAFQWDYFAGHLIEVLEVYRGGLSGFGSLIGGISSMSIYSWAEGHPLGKIANGLIPLAASMIVAAWLGCWVIGCAYGPETTAWWGLPAIDQWGEVVKRIPTQLLGALITIDIFWLVETNHDKFTLPGEVASLGLLGIAIQFFILTYIRDDPMPVINGLRLDAWAAAALTTMGAVFYWRIKQTQRNSIIH